MNGMRSALSISPDNDARSPDLSRPSAATGCALCGGPLPRAEERYCCAGCARVAEILIASDYAGDPRQSAVYREALRSGLVAAGESPKSADGIETAGQEHARTIALGLEGLWCPSCAWLIESVLRQTPGILSARVFFVNEMAEVTYDATVIGSAGVVEHITSLGYGVSAGAERNQDRGLLVRLGLAAVLAMNVMMLSYAYYAHHLGIAGGRIASVLPWLLLGLTAPVVFGAGGPILRRGWLALCARAVTMDTLISTAVLSALGFSILSTVRGSQAIYYDVASALVAFWLFGRFVEQCAFRKAARTGEAVRRLLPRKALRVESGVEHWVGVERLAVGDRIRVAPGERIPVDGRVFSRAGLVSTGIVNGEQKPRNVRRGDRVPGGAANGSTELDLEVTAAASQSLLARVADHVARAAGRSGDADEITDALARLLLPVVVVLAAATVAGWMANGLAAAGAFERGLAVLVVSCPCALAVAAPLARVVSAGTLARQGVVVRGRSALEQLATARCIAFDKTGTLTEGKMTLVSAKAVGAREEEALGVLAALERGVGHPIAEAARAAAQLLPSRPAGQIRVTEGCGVRGRVDKQDALAGRPAWVAAQKGPVPEPLQEAVESARQAGYTVVSMAFGDNCWATFAFGDRARTEAAAVVAALEDLGITTVILSGDAQGAADAVAHELGMMRAVGDLPPEEKVAWLETEGAVLDQRPVFVGDGINDAPALAASVGIAVATGTDFARETADVLLVEPGLEVLPRLVVTARRLQRIIRQNLAWAILYNVVAIPLAVAGALDPVVAAAAMVGSNLLVTLNTLRLRGRIRHYADANVQDGRS